MSEWIRIRVKDFYKDAVGELEYTYVTREVYEALVDTFRKEAHAQEMRDIRHTTKDGYPEYLSFGIYFPDGIGTSFPMNLSDDYIFHIPGNLT